MSGRDFEILFKDKVIDPLAVLRLKSECAGVAVDSRAP
jgi:hypothetical protein